MESELNRTKSLPRIAPDLSVLCDENTQPTTIEQNPPKSFRPYSASSKSLLARSKTKLIRSNANRRNLQNISKNNNIRRPQTAKHSHSQKYQKKPSKQSKYANWGMKMDSTETLRDQILTLKKKFRSVSDENRLIKTEKRRIEKLLRKNDTKLKRLLNTVSAKPSLINQSQNNKTENRKYATTQLLDMLNDSHNSNVSLKLRLHKTKTELKESKNKIKELQQMKMKSNTNTNSENSAQNNEEMIEYFEKQLSEYKSELRECHSVFDKLTTSNDNALQTLEERDTQNRELSHENMELKRELKELKAIIENEQFFNHKILNEMTDLKSKNKDLQTQLHKQSETELQSQSQIKKLSEKFKGIEIEFKETIRSYQTLEKSCLRKNDFMNRLIVYSQNQTNKDIKSLCHNLKMWFSNSENNNINTNVTETVNDATLFLRQLFETKNELLQTMTPPKQEKNSKLEIIQFKSHKDTNHEIIENKTENIRKSVTLTDAGDDDSSMSLYNASRAVVEIISRSNSEAMKL